MKSIRKVALDRTRRGRSGETNEEILQISADATFQIVAGRNGTLAARIIGPTEDLYVDGVMAIDIGTVETIGEPPHVGARI